MNTITEIQQMPTTTGEPPMVRYAVHESVLRAYNILEKVKDYLRRGVPADVLLELIADMEGLPSSVYVSE